jgi:signal transduction histidine kinase
MVMTLVVAMIAVVCVGLVSRHFTIQDFREYVSKSEAIDLERFRAPLIENYQQHGSWNGAQPLLDQMAGTSDRQLILVDAQRKTLLASPIALLQQHLQVSAGNDISWQREVKSGGDLRVQQMELRNVDHIALSDSRGAAVGVLYAIPAPAMAGPRDANNFVSSLNRTLLWAALASGIVALLGALIISRRILRPVEALTGAVRQMESGDLSQHVAVSSKDEIGELALAFNSMADKLVRAEQLRRNMANDIAHELRTPLTNIRCQIETIQDGLVKPSGELFDSLHAETMLLQRLIDDLQDLALAEAGQLRLKPRRVSVRNEVTQAADALRHASLTGGPAIRIEIPEDCPDVFADAQRFAQVLRNLLQNAITHTPEEGAITVRARSVNSNVELSIADNGSGIEAEDLPFIFERFYRADASRDRATGGAGLGLAIARQIVLAHGGDIRIESEPGQGTKVFFTLPICAGQ